jgi:hypothetical protein
VGSNPAAPTKISELRQRLSQARGTDLTARLSSWKPRGTLGQAASSATAPKIVIRDLISLVRFLSHRLMASSA